MAVKEKTARFGGSADAGGLARRLVTWAKVGPVVGPPSAWAACKPELWATVIGSVREWSPFWAAAVDVEVAAGGAGRVIGETVGQAALSKPSAGAVSSRKRPS